jgi:hypothetical protein
VADTVKPYVQKAKPYAKKAAHAAQVGAKRAAHAAQVGATEMRRRVLPLVEQRMREAGPTVKRGVSRTRAHLRRWGTYYVLIACLLLIAFAVYTTGATIQKAMNKYMKSN